jgi:hypothetical protein
METLLKIQKSGNGLKSHNNRIKSDSVNLSSFLQRPAKKRQVHSAVYAGVKILEKSVRKFLNLSKNRQVELNTKFPDLFKLYCVDETPHYKKGVISVFDHWLTCEEF